MYLARDIQGFRMTIEVCPRSSCTEAILLFHGQLSHGVGRDIENVRVALLGSS